MIYRRVYLLLAILGMLQSYKVAYIPSSSISKSSFIHIPVLISSSVSKMSMLYCRFLLSRKSSGGFRLFTQKPASDDHSVNTIAPNIAYIAVGSNVGDRATNIHNALDGLRALGTIKTTSFLYQSAPMYFTKQMPFLNAVVEFHTSSSSPQILIQQLKSIEDQCGRKKTFTNGPRVIDLDILFFNDATVDEQSSSTHRLLDLRIPHPRIAERDFVLRPMMDIAPEFVHPVTKKSIAVLWSEYFTQSASLTATRTPLRRVIPCVNRILQRTRYLILGKRPLFMGILNVTPDSFSDGGQFYLSPILPVGPSSLSPTRVPSSAQQEKNIKLALEHFERLVQEGADIVDIGGESTRPNATLVAEDDEIHRVIPVIRAIRSLRRYDDILLSIDTRKARVAAEALSAGADIVNDVSAGKYDAPKMLRVVKEWQVPYIAMHMRGDPATMTQPQHLTYIPSSITTTTTTTTTTTVAKSSGVASIIAEELQCELQKIDAVLPRWLQIIDPGIGFAKTASINAMILQPQCLRAWKKDLQNRPMLVGLSRKRFLSQLNQDAGQLSTVLNDSPDAEGAVSAVSTESDTSTKDASRTSSRQRDHWTAGANCAAILGGADILRVHDVAVTKQTCTPFYQLLGSSRTVEEQETM